MHVVFMMKGQRCDTVNTSQAIVRADFNYSLINKHSKEQKICRIRRPSIQLSIWILR